MAVEEHGTCVATYNASGFSYLYHAFGLYYDEANEHCELHGGNLAVIHDDGTLMSIIKGLSVYRKVCNRTRDYLRIGLRKIDDGNYEWIDGSRFNVNTNLSNKINNVPCSNSNSYCILGSSTFYKYLDVQCCDSNSHFAYICQKSIELAQTSISTASPPTCASIVFTKQIQESFTTRTQEISSTSNFAIIGVVSALLTCLVIALIVVAFFKYQNKRKADTKKQSSSKNLNRTNELSNNALIKPVNMLPYPSDTGYASAEYQKKETPNQANMNNIFPNKTSVFNYNLATDTEDSFSESVTDFHETPTANYASVDFEKKQPSMEFAMETETAKEPQSETYAVVNKLKTKKTAETESQNNVNEEDEEDTAYSNFTSDDLYSRLKI